MGKSRIGAVVLAAVLICGVARSPAEEPASGSSAFGAELLDRFPAEQKEKILKGEATFESVITEGAGGGHRAHGRTSVLVERPVEECFRIFCEFDQQYRFFPRMKVSRVLRREDDTVVIYKELSYPLITIKFTHRLTVDPVAFRVDFVTDPDGVNNIKFTSGYFRFEAVDEERTLFTYEMTKMDVGFRIPGFIRTFMASRDLPGIAATVKKRIESGGIWEK